MTTLSPAASLAWKIASIEARQSRAEFIEKEHLMIGLLSLDKILPEEAKKDSPAADSIARERDAISQLLSITGLEATVIRRLLRRAPNKGRSGTAGSVLHRSPECKIYFDRAEAHAIDRSINALDLFSAIMDRPGPVISEVLADSRRCIASPRETDIHVPRENLSANPWNQAARFDLRVEISLDIARSKRALELVPPGSQEFRLLRTELVKKGCRLSLLCLTDHDSPGLLAVMQTLLPWAGDLTADVARVIGEMEAAPDKEYFPDPARVRMLLTGLENMVGDKA